MQTIIGGLHIDDFPYAVRMGEWIGKVFVAFRMSADSYHWEAVYEEPEDRDFV